MRFFPRGHRTSSLPLISLSLTSVYLFVYLFSSAFDSKPCTCSPKAAEHQYAGEASENFPVQYDPETGGHGPQETLYYPVLPQEQERFPEQVPVAVPSVQPQEQEVIQINDVPIYIPEEYRGAHEDVPFAAHLVPTPEHEEEVAATPVEGAAEEYLQPREASEGIPLGPLEPEASDAFGSKPLQAALHAQAESEPEAQPEPQPEPEPEPEPLAEERSADEGEEEEGYDIPHQAASTLMAAVSAAQPHAQ